MNTRPNDLIISSGDSQIYYVSHLNVIVATMQPYVDHFFWDNLSLSDVVQRTYDLGARFVWHADGFEKKYWGFYDADLDRMVSRSPEAIVFNAPDGYVVDIPKLYEAVFLSCPVAPYNEDELLFRMLTWVGGKQTFGLSVNSE